MHKHGLVHRDIKPSNVIFVNGVPKLGDIGLVTEAGDTQSIVGTEGYIPPEGPGTPQADIFSLGKVLYEISTGLDRRRFAELPEDLARGRIDTPSSSSTKSCSKPAPRIRPARYQSAEEMRADLELLHRGKSIKRQHALERRWMMTQRISLFLALFAVITVASGPFLTGFGIRMGRKHVAQPSDSLAMTGTQNVEAYNLYVKARVCLRRFTIEGEKLGRQYLEEATKLDPNFLAAYELRFESYGNSLLEDAGAGMRATAEKLMELRPD